MAYTPPGYKKAPSLSQTSLCIGCAFMDEDVADTGQCWRVTEEWREAGTSEAATHPCSDVVWIPDTPEGMTDYITRKLES